VTIRGTRKAEDLKEGQTYHRRERETGEFVRTLQMPFELDPNKVDAELEKGVLHLRLPRSESDKPRKISVKSV
jgi:HSP20 family protein